MILDVDILQDVLCKAMCANIKIRKKNDSLLIVDTPFLFSDGDPYQIYIKERPAGILRISDNGHTIMHLSYENDVSKFREGTRGDIFNSILSEFELHEEDGEFYIDTSSNNLVESIFNFGQALTKITDLTFLNRLRAESTFYQDLEERLGNIVDSERIKKNYLHPDLPNNQDYPIDYYIEGKQSPLLLFGIPGKDKARLATIILERLLRENIQFENLLVFMDQALIPKGDLARLSNVGGDMISSLDAQEDLRRKIFKRIEA